MTDLRYMTIVLDKFNTMIHSICQKDYNINIINEIETLKALNLCGIHNIHLMKTKHLTNEKLRN